MSQQLPLDGPCLTSWATARTAVVVNDVATDPRWPLWSEAVAELAMLQMSETLSRAMLQMSETLSRALQSRDTIYPAQGFLMREYGLNEDRALQELVHLSQSSRQSLLSVSTEILSGTRNSSHDRT